MWDRVVGAGHGMPPLPRIPNHRRSGPFFASDVIAIRDVWTITLSARFNRTSISNLDRLNPGGGSGSLDGEHAFSRLNPAAGVTFSPRRDLNLYAGYGEGSRAPTSIELGCADPEQPCKLPNALAGDPPLDQVVTRTVEVGVRGTRGAVSWNAGFFHADNSDDILFVASEQTGFGYFKNFGKTRRQGIELGVNARKGRFSRRRRLHLAGRDVRERRNRRWHRQQHERRRQRARGHDRDRGRAIGFRSIPQHMFKAFADVQVMPRLSVDVNLIAASGVFARGNENNAHEPDGTYYLGPGSTPAYGIVNLGVRYDLNKWLQLIAQFNNVFDTQYYTAAQLQGTGFTSTGNFIARPFPAVGGEFPVQQATFYAPGAPATYWIGTRVRF